MIGRGILAGIRIIILDTISLLQAPTKEKFRALLLRIAAVGLIGLYFYWITH